VVVAMLAIGLQSPVRQRAAARRDRAIVESIKADGDSWFVNARRRAWGPTWLRRLVGDASLANFDRVASIKLRATDIPAALGLDQVEEVSTDGALTNSQLQRLTEFPNLASLDIWASFVPPVKGKAEAGPPHAVVEELLVIPRLENLRELTLFNVNFRGEGLEYLPQLEVLTWDTANVTDGVVDAIGQMRNLRHLSLSGVHVTSAGLAHLIQTHLIWFPDFRSFNLSGTSISDSDIPLLCQLSHLEDLSLRSTAISGEGVDKLQAALPNCTISW